MPAAVPEPGGPNWANFTDENVVVAGLDIVARRQVIEQIAKAAERLLADHSSAIRLELERHWGTFAACQILQTLTWGGRKTWTNRARGRPGLLSLLDDLERPEPLRGHQATLQAINTARRQALKALWGFTVDVPAQVIKGLQGQALNRPVYKARRGRAPLSEREFHRRIAQVFRFYGVARPSPTRSKKRAWSVNLWCLARVHYHLERFHNVRLAALHWLPPAHFRTWMATDGLLAGSGKQANAPESSAGAGPFEGAKPAIGVSQRIPAESTQAAPAPSRLYRDRDLDDWADWPPGSG